jgi:hypothetical protein
MPTGWLVYDRTIDGELTWNQKEHAVSRLDIGSRLGQKTFGQEAYKGNREADHDAWGAASNSIRDPRRHQRRHGRNGIAFGLA